MFRIPRFPLKKKRRPVVLSFLFLVCLISSLHGQDKTNQSLDALLGKLKSYAANNSPEKIYVQTDKEFYSSGETIWFKTYLVDGITHAQSAKSKIAYVELWSEKDSLIAQRKLYVAGLGAAGDIKIDDNLYPGTYTLRAYTKYMLNEKEPLFFQKQIPIWDSEKITPGPQQPIVDDAIIRLSESAMVRPNIEFFPEGGHLVCGLENVMGIKATNNLGDGISLQGKILDENDVPVAFFRTFDFGLGSVSFVPEAEKMYYAQLDNGEIDASFPLPKPLDKGYLLNLKNKGDHILINVTTNDKKGLQGLLLLGHLRGEIIYQHHIEQANTKRNAFFKLSTDKLKDGVAQFTLFAQDGEPLCERLVFVDSPDNPELEIITEFMNYGVRESVSTMIALTDKQGIPIPGELSVSVVSSTNHLKRNAETNIKSWLLLDSDLGHTVPDPDYFFRDDSSSRKQLLDILMLTHGWRRFVWKDFQDTLVTKAPQLQPEKGIVIQGRTTSFKNNSKSLKSQVKFTILDQGAYQEQSPTNSNGKFSFGPFIFQDSIQGVLEAVVLGKKGKQEVAIYLDSTVFSVPFIRPVGRMSSTSLTRNVQDYLETVQKKKEADFIYDPKVTQLEEVTVIGEEKTRAKLIQEKVDEITLHNEPTMRLFTDSLPGLQGASMMDMLRRVPGAQVFGTYPDQKATLRLTGSFGAPEPLYVVDGGPVSWEFVRFMMASEVVFLDILKGGAAAIYGMRGGTGVVAIYTKGSLLVPPAKPKSLPGVASFTVSGVYKAREFYVPDYAVPKKEHDKPDYRTTLHWEPKLPVAKNSSPSFSFYTGDGTGEYIIKVEGMTLDGQPVQGLSRFSVSKEGSKM